MKNRITRAKYPTLKEFWFHSDVIPIETLYPKPKINEYKITLCGLLDLNTKMFSIGISFCNLTTEKNYNRKLGNTIAYGRAMRNPLITYKVDWYGTEQDMCMKTHYNNFLEYCSKIIAQPEYVFESFRTKTMVYL